MSYLLPVLTTLLSAIGAFVGVRFASRSNLIGIEKQSRRQASIKIAEFRQEWINQLRDAMSEFCGILITPGTQRQAAQERFYDLRCKIDLLMNPNDSAYPELNSLLSKLVNSISGASVDNDISRLISICQNILKQEWETLKSEIRDPHLEV